MGQVEQAAVSAQAALDKIEEIRSRRKAGSEILQEAWQSGELTVRDLPCWDRCNGQIRVQVGGSLTTGDCPMYLVDGVCPLVTARERELAARLTHAGFGERYHNPDPVRMSAREAVEGWLARFRVNLSQGRGMLLTGDVGVGKTFTLAYVARQLLEDGVGVWKIHTPEFIEMLNDRQTRQQAVRRAVSVDVLMLDDFGSGEIPPWVIGILEGVVENRYGHRNAMFVSTNMTKQKLVEVKEFRRMVDRWRETCTLVEIAGGSLRHAGT